MSDSMIGEIEDIEEDVLKLVQGGEHDPAGVSQRLVERGFADSKIRVAFWFLIGAGQLDLTPNLQFELPSQAVPIASVTEAQVVDVHQRLTGIGLGSAMDQALL
ncbi:MAG: hypothetical protein KC438_03495 [Thermomicrobiales bacterium]|nr:hypothetical protein [Thermomicrobiales bacterium]MCO5223141.1 hypothetical protein [Thermomicrobiales bacterium]